VNGRHSTQRAVWRNGGCGSLESTTEQQVTWLVASVGSPPLRQAADTLGEGFFRVHFQNCFSSYFFAGVSIFNEKEII